MIPALVWLQSQLKHHKKIFCTIYKITSSINTILQISLYLLLNSSCKFHLVPFIKLLRNFTAEFVLFLFHFPLESPRAQSISQVLCEPCPWCHCHPAAPCHSPGTAGSHSSTPTPLKPSTELSSAPKEAKHSQLMCPFSIRDVLI